MTRSKLFWLTHHTDPYSIIVPESTVYDHPNVYLLKTGSALDAEQVVQFMISMLRVWASFNISVDGHKLRGDIFSMGGFFNALDLLTSYASGHSLSPPFKLVDKPAHGTAAKSRFDFIDEM
jgi:hypothetical protein